MVFLSRSVRALLLGGALAAAGCSWIELTDAGAEVAQGDPGAIDACRLVGNVTSTTQNRVLLKRSRAQVSEELIVLARNEAARLGGDTIVPKAPMHEGRQDFNVYRCAVEASSPASRD